MMIYLIGSWWWSSFIFIALIALAVVGIHFYNKYFCYTDIAAVDNSFKITVPNRVKYKVKESSDENYSLDFYYVKDVDKKVVIDVAVKLAKKYLDSTDYKFVNAILDKTLQNA